MRKIIVCCNKIKCTKTDDGTRRRSQHQVIPYYEGILVGYPKALAHGVYNASARAFEGEVHASGDVVRWLFIEPLKKFRAGAAESMMIVYRGEDLKVQLDGSEGMDASDTPQPQSVPHVSNRKNRSCQACRLLFAPPYPPPPGRGCICDFLSYSYQRLAPGNRALKH